MHSTVSAISMRLVYVIRVLLFFFLVFLGQNILDTFSFCLISHGLFCLYFVDRYFFSATRRSLLSVTGVVRMREVPQAGKCL